MTVEAPKQLMRRRRRYKRDELNKVQTYTGGGSNAVAAASALLLESGSYILLEDGSKILLE